MEWCPHISGHTVFEIKKFTCVCVCVCVCVQRKCVSPHMWLCGRKLKENTTFLSSFLLLVLTSFSLFLALCSRCTVEVTGAVVSVTHGFNHSHLPPRDSRYYFFFFPRPVIAFVFRARGGECALSKVLQQRAAPPILSNSPPPLSLSPSVCLSLSHTHTHTHLHTFSPLDHVTLPLPSLAESIRLHLFLLRRASRERKRERERDIASHWEREGEREREHL